MKTSPLNIIWASKPGCRLPVAELWIGTDALWCVVFADDSDNDTLKLEILPPINAAEAYAVDLTQAELLIMSAKQELLDTLANCARRGTSES